MKSVRTVFLISLAITLVSLGVVVFAVLSGPDRIEIEGQTLAEAFESGELMPLIIIPVVLVIVAFSMRPFLRIIFPPKIKDGVTAEAKVLKVWDTGVSINDNPQVGLLLQVTPSMSPAFQAEAKTVVSRLNAALVQPGVTAEVEYDPLKPQRLQVKTLHILPAGSGSAAERMEELAHLRQRRLITDEEYQKKREEILKAL